MTCLAKILLWLSFAVRTMQYLWSGRRAGGFALLLLAPPALVAAAASDLAAVQLLGLLGAAAAGAQFAAQRYLRQQGLRLV